MVVSNGVVAIAYTDSQYITSDAVLKIVLKYHNTEDDTVTHIDTISRIGATVLSMKELNGRLAMIVSHYRYNGLTWYTGHG